MCTLDKNVSLIIKQIKDIFIFLKSDKKCIKLLPELFEVICDSKVSVGDGRVVRWSWVNFQCRGVLLVWMRVGQGPTALAIGAGGGCLDIFTLIYPFSSLSPSLWETTRYRLKYCLKGSLSPKTTNQPTKVSVSFLKSFSEQNTWNNKGEEHSFFLEETEDH